jgi:PAS domain S-box-containing protein
LELAYADLLSETHELRARLEEAEEALRAIREGEVDAVIVSGSKGDRVFSLAETENLHRLMVETMNEAGLATSSDGLLLYANDRAAALFQRTRSELLGHHIEELVASGEVPRLRRLLDASKAGTADDRILFRSAGGADVPMHLWASRLPRPGEAMVCLVGTDLTRLEADQAVLTQLRHHQEALKASRAQALELLSQALLAREQAAQLAHELRESDRRKDAFLATLAHELRNPLVPIRNALEILRFQEGETVAVVEARAMMERHLAHLVRLVDDLMDVSRITHGKIELLKQPLQLASVIQSAVEMVRPTLQESGQRLSIELPSDDVWLEADPTRLSQVFGNLLNNAIKYTKPGQAIRVTACRQAEPEVVVAVEDQGVGIPAEILPHVFDMFAQGDDMPARKQAGLGIGLTLVRELVELHGGRVEAFSAGLNQGSRIQVFLPLEDVAASSVGGGNRLSSRSASSLRGLRILVVDDNEEAAVSLAHVLKLKGAHVRLAFGGCACLTALEVDSVDAVILDIGMPDLDGHEVARRIRAREQWDSVRLIAMTGLGDAASRERSMDVGFDHHLVKPVSFDVLDAILRSPAEPALEPVCGAVYSARAMPIGRANANANALTAPLLHDLAQPLSSARCIAIVARTLAMQTTPQSHALCDTIGRLDEELAHASRLVEQLRAALLDTTAN